MDEQTRKALELAREALQRGDTYDREHAVAAIDAALSAPAAPVAKGEPVAVAMALVYEYCQDDKGDVAGDCWKAANVEWRDGCLDGLKTGDRFTLYAAPAAPVAQPSDAEINKLACAAGFSPMQVVTDNGAFGRFASAILALRPAPAAPVAQCACSPDVLLDSYAGGAAPEGLFGRVTLLINGQRVDYVPATAAPVARPLAGLISRASMVLKPSAGHEVTFRFDDLEDATRMRLWAESRVAQVAATAAPVAQGEPVGWGQLGMRNGRAYVRMHYEGHIYPPPADVIRNLNMVPLHAASVAQPLTDEQVAAMFENAGGGFLSLREASVTYARGLRDGERAHGIGQGGAA